MDGWMDVNSCVILGQNPTLFEISFPVCLMAKPRSCARVQVTSWVRRCCLEPLTLTPG